MCLKRPSSALGVLEQARSMPRCVISSRRGRGAHCRRSVLEQSLRGSPVEARRTAFSVALAIFWRMRGEVQQPRTVAPGHDKYYSGLRGRPEGPGSRHRRRARLPPRHPAPARRRRNLEPVRQAQTCPSRSRPSSRRAVNTGLAAPSRTPDWTASPSGRRAAPARTTTFWTQGQRRAGRYLPGQGRRAHHADVQHHAVPAARPSRTMVSPACGSGGPARVTGSSLPSARTRNSRSLPAGIPGSPPSPGWVQIRAPSA